MAKVIAVANQKGGCSKTSVVANLGSDWQWKERESL